MQKILRIDTSHIDDQNLQHFVAYFSESKKAKGKTICVYDRDSRKVIFFDKRYETDYGIIYELTKEKHTLENRFQRGFVSWQETHYEMVQAITTEMIKENPGGVIGERHEAQGHGGLYELAEELTSEFETIHKDVNWNEMDYWPEIEHFVQIKCYEPKSEYKPLYNS